ncbi:MAG: nickel pincer cofactor biosynthesis protein LarC [Clostridiales bacterium]|nr:nickel pincer cofactor biosynthesis protein LarC [Clostridiales bacterium]
MKVLYIDCSMGAAGDMLSAALFELLPKEEREAFVEKLNSRGIPGVKYVAEPAVKCGITGTHMSVLVNGEEEGCGCGHEHSHEHEHEHHHDHEHDHDHDHEHEHSHEHGHSHHHSSMHDIEHIVGDHMKLPTSVALDVLAVYQEIAEAESHVHGQPVDQIHFHEVGSMDAVADITAVCLLMKKLAPDEVIVSPIHVGSGTVKCAHGILPVPAPATARILQGIPTYSADINGELCTPTGAALLKHFATGFGKQPMMKTSAIGYGMGKKDFPRANCVRVMLGETVDEKINGSASADAAFAAAPAVESAPAVSASASAVSGSSFASNGDIIELSCNVDDMTGEAVGFAMERLFEAGANEVFTVPCGMKKSRPGILLRVLCKPEDKEKFVKLLFEHTTTIGIRETKMQRYMLDRQIYKVDTSLGSVRVKVSSGYGTTRKKIEYEDLAKIAKEKGISLSEVEKIIQKDLNV